MQVERAGRLGAAVELVSPRNKDRPAGRDQYAGRCLNYPLGGVHLLLVDVHRRPAVGRQPLAPGRPLPPMPLPLGPDAAVTVDLDGTHSRAAADSYLDG